MQIYILLGLLILSPWVHADNRVNWSEGAPISEGGRANPYAWDAHQWPQITRAGRLHALLYPVSVTGVLLPLKPIQDFLEKPSSNPVRAILQSLSSSFSKIENFEQAMSWIGLHRYPQDAGTANSEIPLPPGMHAGSAMGLSIVQQGGATGFTFSCAACHTGQLFGRPVMGLTNRFVRANALFMVGKAATQAVPSPAFAMALGASRAERLMYRRTRHNMYSVGSKRPELLGLDTSLAHVALSLSRRQKDAFATKDANKAFHPDDELLATMPADSKPAVWWNLKYKNRWLSDGSVLSGNPIVTNILWNEIGRGTDLRELENWLSNNVNITDELTTAVFASEPPRIEEYFPAERIRLQSAQAGQHIFAQHCARCHGNYEKAWDQAGAAELPYAEQLKTTKVVYHSQTPVIDVGTDANRRRGMKSLEQLNHLQISKTNGVKVVAQNGYVPPPLVGIWARWPYFHNNSAPSLCAVLSVQAERPSVYYAGEANDKELDFDFSCNGYPTGDRTPTSWKQEVFRYDTRRSGLSNQGHDQGILLRNGREVLTAQDRLDLIQFLQTL